MPEDSGLIIGATIDVEQLKSGLQTSVEEIKSSTQNMGVAFQEMSTTALRATRQISDDTRVAAETISAEWTRAAEASLAYSRAQQEVRAATVLAKQSAGEDAEATAVLAAAKQRAALASQELAAATKATIVAEEEEVGIVAGVTAAFSTLEGVIAPILAAGFLIHFIDESKDAVLGMHDLAEKTGFSIQVIAGLKFAAEDTGVRFEALTTGLGRLSRAQELIAQGNKGMIQALADIGLKVEDVKNLAPEQLFFKVASAMEQTESPAARSAAAIALFGKGGQELIPILLHYGANLEEVVRQHGELSGVTDKSSESALRYQHAIAEFSEQWRSVMIPTISMAATALGFLDKAFVRTGMAGSIISNDLIAAWHAAGGLIANLGTAMEDVAKGNFREAKAVMAAGLADVEAANERASQKDFEIWQNAQKRIADINLAPKVTDSASDKGASGDKVQPEKDTRFQQFKLELDQMREAEEAFHQLSKAEEASFWESKLEIARGMPKLYAEVYHEFAAADRAAKQQSLKDEVSDVEAKLAAVKTGSHEKVAILTEELTHLRSLHAEETAEYKRLTTQLASATREAAAADALEAAKAEEAKVRLTKDGTLAREKAQADYVAAIRKLYGQDSSQYETALTQQASSHQKFIDSQRKMAEEEANHEERMDELQLQGAKQEFTAEEQLGIVSNSQKLAADLAFAAREHEIKLKALNDKLALLAKDPDTNAAELSRLHNQTLEEDKRYENQKNQITLQATTYRKQLEQGFEQSMKSGFSSAISGMILGQQSFAQSFQQIMRGFVSTFANVLSEMLTQWITTHILMKAFGIAQTTTTNTAKATSDAAVAAAGTFAWWSSANPLIAPAMAAAAFGEGMTWAGLAGATGSAKGGGLLDEDGPIFAHANEMILPADISRSFKDMFSGTFEPPSALKGSFGANVHNEQNSTHEGDSHVHFNYHAGDVNALDNSGVAATLKKNRRALEQIMMKSVKTGHINPKRFMR